MLKLLPPEVGAAAFSTSGLAAASCSCQAPVWMAGAGAPAATLVVGGQIHDRRSQDPAFLTTCMTGIDPSRLPSAASAEPA